MNGSDSSTMPYPPRTRNGQPSSRPSLSLAAVTPRSRSRSFIVAWTGSGKSTLAAALLEEYHRLHPRHVLYLIDPKRRFVPVEIPSQDDYTGPIFPDGPASQNFGRRDGVAVVGDFLTKARTPPDRGPAVFVVQDEASIHELCEWLYKHATVRRPSLLFADESFDLVSRRQHDPFRRLIQQGREIGVGSVVINQRPANIDQTWITESQQLYVGRLTKPEDRDRMVKASAVEQAWPILAKPIPKFQWVYIDQENERFTRFRLTGV